MRVPSIGRQPEALLGKDVAERGSQRKPALAEKDSRVPVGAALREAGFEAGDERAIPTVPHRRPPAGLPAQRWCGCRGRRPGKGHNGCRGCSG